MSRARQVVTAAQVEELAKIIEVKFKVITDKTSRMFCWSYGYGCQHRATQLAIASRARAATCSNSCCRLAAALNAHFLSLPDDALPRFKELRKKIGPALPRDIRIG